MLLNRILTDFIIFLLLLCIVYQKIAQLNAVSMATVTNRKAVCVMQDGLAQIVIFKPVLLSA